MNGVNELEQYFRKREEPAKYSGAVLVNPRQFADIRWCLRIRQSFIDNQKYIMKTTFAAAFLFLCSHSALSADINVREITPDRAKHLGWKIEIREKEEYVQFTLYPPAHLLTEGRTAHLVVQRDRHLITACILGTHKTKHGERYEVSVSKEYLKYSLFELGSKGLDEDGESYRMYLRKFVPRRKAVLEKSVPAVRTNAN